MTYFSMFLSCRCNKRSTSQSVCIATGGGQLTGYFPLVSDTKLGKTVLVVLPWLRMILESVFKTAFRAVRSCFQSRNNVSYEKKKKTNAALSSVSFCQTYTIAFSIGEQNIVTNKLFHKVFITKWSRVFVLMIIVCCLIQGFSVWRL